MADAFTLYKLIILYMLDKVAFPLSNAQLSEFILDREYTDYFTIQSALSELDEAGFLKVKTIRNTSLYEITDEGRKTLSYFGRRISTDIREEIDAFLREHSCELRNETSTLADYFRTPEGEYAVRCRVLERDSTLIDLTLTVPLKEQAESICGRWREKSQGLYAFIIKELLS